MGEQESGCAGFEFFSNFDSANLARVQYVQPFESLSNPPSKGRNYELDAIDVEFNIWTKPDCVGTEFENINRTWFYFGMRANAPGIVVRLNIVDLNRQAKMYSQGMAPVYRIVPGKLNWERIRDKPTYTTDNDIFILSFKYKTPENVQSITYFAFTYPFSFVELTNMLTSIDRRFSVIPVNHKDDIYYHREVLCYSLEGRKIDLITISNHRNMSKERESRLKNLFPDQKASRPFRFIGKKIIFLSARVHPGETPSSFVINGFMNLLLNKEDCIAGQLRKLYVFKIIPMLNPDGVACGHYRTDTRGVNLNRMYLNPSFSLHPSIYAARALIRYYHYGFEKEDVDFDLVPPNDNLNDDDDMSSVEDSRTVYTNDNKLSKKVSHMTLDENQKNEKGSTWCSKCKTNILKLEDNMPGISDIIPTFNHVNPSTGKNLCRNCGTTTSEGEEMKREHGDFDQNNSGLFMYIDMHGHASKKGIFMYGNHFEEYEKNIECMLLPKIMSLNNHNFHFTACNFTERNMYLRDRHDGMSREGCGRVAVLKLTGLVRSYTLECNYNTGRMVNILPPGVRELNKTAPTPHVPPKYTPQIFEEVGKTLGASILDLTTNNPYTRLPNSQFHTLSGLRDWLRVHCSSELGDIRYSARFQRFRNSASLHAQGKSMRPVILKTRSVSFRTPNRVPPKRSTSVPVERKENVYEETKTEQQPSCSNILQGARSKPKLFKRKKETSLKLKGKTSDKKLNRPSAKKLQTIKETHKDRSEERTSEDSKIHKGSGKQPNRIKLHEICFIKSPEGKRIVAKYKPKDEEERGSEDNLIVEWDSSNNAQVFSHKTKSTGPPIKPMVSESGQSRDGVFRVHNFAKIGKMIRHKRPLRRLTSTNEPSKTERLKKRKILKTHT